MQKMQYFQCFYKTLTERSRDLNNFNINDPETAKMQYFPYVQKTLIERSHDVNMFKINDPESANPYRAES